MKQRHFEDLNANLTSFVSKLSQSDYIETVERVVTPKSVFKL